MPKDSYALLNIYKLVGNSVDYKLLPFLDVYFGYKKIPMCESDREKTNLTFERDKYQYNMMLFGLKSVKATYQRMMNKVFKKEIGEML